jgi:TetR/AcrR family transcriptional repressor of mexJK operon
MNENASKSRILSTARALFFVNGFDKVTTDLLAREASVSKATIYRYFDNMSGILQHVLEAEADVFRAEVLGDISSHPDLRTALTSFGRKFLSFLSEQDSVKFTCLIHEVARDYPQVGRIFYTAAFEAVCTAVSGRLAQGQETGELRGDFDPADVAEDLISLLKGFGTVRAQLGLTTRPYKDIDQHVARGVDTILIAYRASDGPALA